MHCFMDGINEINLNYDYITPNRREGQWSDEIC